MPAHATNTPAAPSHSTVSKRSAVTASASGPTASRIHQPPQSVSNRALYRLLQPLAIQPKLAVSHPDDQYEREADRVADDVMRMPETQAGGGVQRTPLSIQRVCSTCEQEVQRQTEAGGTGREEDDERKIHVSRCPLHVSCMCADCSRQYAEIRERKTTETSGEESEVQAKEGAARGPEVSGDAEAYVSGRRGGGQALAPATREYFEARFGRDFGDVRIHTESAASETAQGLGAHAFTAGNRIFFNQGAFAPASFTGRRLLAHELTHVVQQTGAPRAVQRDTAAGSSLYIPAAPPPLPAGWEKALLEILKEDGDAEYLWTLIEGELLHAEPKVFAAVYGRLSPDNPPRTDKLAAAFNRKFKGDIRKRFLERFRKVARHYKPRVKAALPLDPMWDKALLGKMREQQDPEIIWAEIDFDMLRHEEPEVWASLYVRLARDNPPRGDALAATFNRVFTGKLREQILDRLEEVGRQFKVPSGLPPGTAPGRETQPVRQLGRIDAPKGVYMREVPGGDTDDATLLPFDTLVSVEKKTIETKKKAKSWFYVVALGDDHTKKDVSGTGFVEEYHVALKPPEPTAHLYLVKAGDMLKDIAAKFYKRKFEWGNDARVYVQAIYHANKERDVVFRQNLDLTVDRRALETDDLQEALVLWRQARVVKGQALWMPSDEFVQKLKAAGLIHQASITKTMWDATIGAIQALIDWAQFAAGFILGLLEGAWDALKDLFTGVLDLIKALWSVVKAIFGDWDDLKKLGAALKKLWVNRADVFNAIFEDFTKKWDNPDDFDRGLFQGNVLGYIMMTAFIMLVTMGAGAAMAGAGRLGKFISLIKVLDKAGDITTFARGMASAVRLPGKVVEEARGAIKGKIGKVTDIEPPKTPKPSGVEPPKPPDVEPPKAPDVEPPPARDVPTRPHVDADVVAKENIGDGHHIQVRKSGDIEVCSETPCPLLEVVYADILKTNHVLEREMGRIRKLRRTDPKKAAKLSKALEKKLAAAARSKGLEYLKTLVERYPRLRHADLRPKRRPMGEPGAFEESALTGSGRESWNARLRDGGRIELDDIAPDGAVIDSKMRDLEVGKELPESRTPDVLEEIEGPPGARTYPTFPEAEQKKLLRQLRFARENGLPGVRWLTNSPALMRDVRRYKDNVLTDAEQKMFTIRFVKR